MSWFEFGIVVVAALVAVLIAVVIIRLTARGSPTVVVQENEAALAFLFNAQQLVHAAPAALPLVENDGEASDWSVLRRNVIARFPTFPKEPPPVKGTSAEVVASDPDDAAVVRIHTFGDHTRVELVESSPEDLSRDAHEMRTLRILVDRLGRVCNTSPYPMWQTDDKGHLIWANAAYDVLADSLSEEKQAESQKGPILDILPAGDTPRRARASIVLQNDHPPSWFDVTATPQSDGLISHAVNIDAVVQAEIAQRNFVQTLAKTFAQLSIGLAIFDRNGQLALFNPALVDLSGLPAVFLSTRPDLLTFFDRLRDNRVMPEPKNYSNWRQEMANVISAASDGKYQETWNLDNGRTYRVNGRPHPDGAVAFLIEDISAEVSLTRNFRAELELGQSILDTLDDGLVVFSSAGILSFCNQAYRELWSVDPENSFADMTIVDSVRVWTEQCVEATNWNDVREYIMRVGDRKRWRKIVKTEDGRTLGLTVEPISSGATVLRFAPQTVPETESDLQSTS